MPVSLVMRETVLQGYYNNNEIPPCSPGEVVDTKLCKIALLKRQFIGQVERLRFIKIRFLIGLARLFLRC